MFNTTLKTSVDVKQLFDQACLSECFVAKIKLVWKFFICSYSNSI